MIAAQENYDKLDLVWRDIWGDTKWFSGTDIKYTRKELANAHRHFKQIFMLKLALIVMLEVLLDLLF